MKKRIIPMILLAMLILLTPATLKAASKLYTTGDVNLRWGPGKDYAAYTSVKKGTALTYLNKYSYDYRGVKWYKVKYKKKKLWVSSRYAKFSKPSRKVITTRDVNLRWGPGKYYDVYTSVKGGKALTYAKKSSYDSRGVKWYRVKYKGYYLWVSSRYSYLN